MKSILSSKTFWFNLPGVILFIVQKLTGHQLVPDDVLIGGLGTGNIGLRLVTKEPVSITGKA